MPGDAEAALRAVRQERAVEWRSGGVWEWWNGSGLPALRQERGAGIGAGAALRVLGLECGAVEWWRLGAVERNGVAGVEAGPALRSGGAEAVLGSRGGVGEH